MIYIFYNYVSNNLLNVPLLFSYRRYDRVTLRTETAAAASSVPLQQQPVKAKSNVIYIYLRT